MLELLGRFVEMNVNVDVLDVRLDTHLLAESTAWLDESSDRDASIFAFVALRVYG